jgi:hypothetical protein
MPALIENPVLNSPYREPARHFRFDADNQITDIIDNVIKVFRTLSSESARNSLMELSPELHHWRVGSN